MRISKRVPLSTGASCVFSSQGASSSAHRSAVLRSHRPVRKVASCGSRDKSSDVPTARPNTPQQLSVIKMKSDVIRVQFEEAIVKSRIPASAVPATRSGHFLL